MDYQLQAIDLKKSFDATRALLGIDLSLTGGKIVGLLGPNGSGKSTLVKIAAGLLTPTSGQLLICGKPVGPETKGMVSYLPDRIYFEQKQRVIDLIDFFEEFYEDFDRQRAESILQILQLNLKSKFNELSKGTKEKVQLALVMSRRAKLYLLDEPIAGVDPAARDYILHTILTNFDPEATILISTHLIADVESVLDEFVFLHNGQIVCHGTVEGLRSETGKSVDEYFREVFRCLPSC